MARGWIGVSQSYQSEAQRVLVLLYNRTYHTELAREVDLLESIECKHLRLLCTLDDAMIAPGAVRRRIAKFSFLLAKLLILGLWPMEVWRHE